MKVKFSVGDKVEMSSAALENNSYSPYWTEKLVVSAVASKYMPAKDFFAQGKPAGYHPGYDEYSGSALYDLKLTDGTELPFSLYDWELKASR